jgi:MFS family permease
VNQLQVLAEVSREPNLRRIAAGFTGFSLMAYGGWITVLVYAYGQGGVSEASLVGFAVLMPAAFVAPLASYAGDRFRRERVIAASYLVQAVVCVVLAVTMLAGAPALLVYIVAGLRTISVTFTRPALSALLPALAETPQSLTSANVSTGIIEAIGAFLGPALAGLLIAVWEPGGVFVVLAPIMALATLTALLVKVPPGRTEAMVGWAPLSLRSEIAGGLSLVRTKRDPRLLIEILGLAFVIVGALDVAYAAIAVELLGESDSTAGFLSAALGAGGLLGAAVSVMLIGWRRLTPTMAVGALMLGIPVITLAVVSQLWLALLVLGVAGAGYRLVLIAGRTLLQGTTPDDVLARVFGVLEGLNMFCFALGAMAVFILEAVGGLKWALLIVGVSFPVVLLVQLRRLLAIDAARPLPDWEFASLLKSVPIFGPLPIYKLEQLAVNVERLTPRPGEVVISEGDAGDTAYVVAAGDVEISKAGSVIGEATVGAYFGEIALLRDVPRTATVTALEGVVLYGFRRDVFLEAVTGHPRSYAHAQAVASGHLDET